MMDNGGSAMDEDDEVTSTQIHIECSHRAQLRYLLRTQQGWDLSNDFF